MKKVLGIVLIGLFAIAMLSSCGSRRGDKGCPTNFGMSITQVVLSI